jgi:hypothetical protein
MIAPRTREEIVRPRRSSGASGRPLNFTVSCHVDRFHFVVTTALALCGAGLLIGLVWKWPSLTALSVVLGWALSSAAVAIAAVLIIILGYRSFSGTAGPLLRRSWLGLVNGALSVGFWVYALL